MKRAPMNEQQAAENAKKVVQSSQRYLNRRRVNSDAQAFEEIKQKVNTPDLARQILGGFEVVERIDSHRKQR